MSGVLERIADALERIADYGEIIAAAPAGAETPRQNTKTPTGRKSAETKAPEPDPITGEVAGAKADKPKKPTKDFITERLRTYMARDGKEATAALLKKIGNVGKFTEFPEAKYEDLAVALAEALD